MASKEKELHEKTQKLRSEYYQYLKDLSQQKKDFKDEMKIKRINTMINNKLVGVLILNEMAHEKKKLKKVM